MDDTVVAVHGGASSRKQNSKELKNFVDEVAKNAKDRLRNGKKAVEVVEHSIRELESHGGLNAGYGSKLQLDGVPRPEAGIMKDDLSMGVAIGLENVKYPISVARVIMSDMSNNIVSSNFSNKIALEEDIEMCSLVTHKRARDWWDLKNEMDESDIYGQVKSIGQHDPFSSGGTVGCVVVDKRGNLCAGTSTGGRLYQVPGRVGDSPLVGCGFYCDEELAISTTGVGESIMKSQLARRVREEYSKSNTLGESVSTSLDYLSSNTDGNAGIIAVERNGGSVVDYNSEDMLYSVK